MQLASSTSLSSAFCSSSLGSSCKFTYDVPVSFLGKSDRFVWKTPVVSAFLLVWGQAASMAIKALRKRRLPSSQ